MIFNIKLIYQCIFLVLLIFLSQMNRAYSFNRTIPLYMGTEGASRSSLNVPEAESTESLLFNPASIDNSRLIEASYWLSDSQFSGVHFKTRRKDIGIQLGLNFYEITHAAMKYNAMVLSGGINRDITGLNIGYHFSYYGLTRENNKAKAIQHSLGIKKSGLLSGQKINVGLAYHTETGLNWDNEFNIINKLPSQITLGAHLFNKGFDLSTGLHYIMPVSINKNSNYSGLVYDEELRLSFSTGIPLRFFKLNLGFQQVLDNEISDISKKFLGIGAHIPFKRMTIKLGYNSNNILETTSEKIEQFSMGVMFKLKEHKNE